MPAKGLKVGGFAGVRTCAELGLELASSIAKSVIFANSEAGYVTIHVTNFALRLRDTGKEMPPRSKKPSFGQDLVEAMKLVVAHHRGEIELEQVVPKRRLSKDTLKPRTPRTN